MENKFEFVPNVFYDLIVFVSSTVTFGLGWSVGLGLLTADRIAEAKAFDVILIVIGVLVFGYEYGRIAETWSSVFVQSPLRFLAKHTPLFRNPDFCCEHPSIETDLGLETFEGARPGGKWAAYFYAMLIDPMLGTDLLKRYAWEKLSRNSGFTFCCLTLASIFCSVLRLFGVAMPFNGPWTFGTARFTGLVSLMLVLTYYEYYRRNSWNYDLIRRVLPVLRRAERLHFVEDVHLRIDGLTQGEIKSERVDTEHRTVAAKKETATLSQIRPKQAGTNIIGFVLLGLAWILARKK